MHTSFITRSLALLIASGSASFGVGAQNLVTNGDFEGGNTGFTSAYAFAPAGNSTEGQYTVRSNPFPWNGLFISAADHTSGSGLMYVGNGSPTNGSVVWASGPIAVAQNTNYFFEAFVMNVCCSSPFPGNSPSILEFSVAGLTTESLGTATTNLALAGTWEGLSKSWNSGAQHVGLAELDQSQYRRRGQRLRDRRRLPRHDEHGDAGAGTGNLRAHAGRPRHRGRDRAAPAQSLRSGLLHAVRRGPSRPAPRGDGDRRATPSRRPGCPRHAAAR